MIIKSKNSDCRGACFILHKFSFCIMGVFETLMKALDLLFFSKKNFLSVFIKLYIISGVHNPPELPVSTERM